MSRASRTGALLTALAVGSLLAACGDGTDEPVAETRPSVEESQPTTAGGDAAGEAPAVPDPLDVASLTDDPCGALSTEQLDEVGLTEGEADEDACQWKNVEESLDLVRLSVFAENENGLDGIYAHEDRNEYFEPTEIAGYPAVYTGVVDSRDTGACDLWVGVNDREVLHIVTNLASSESPDASCSPAGDVAEAAITTLGG